MKRVFNILLGMIITGVVIVGLYFIGKKIYLAFAGLQKDVAVGIIAVSGTVLVSTLTVVLSKYYERKSEIQKELREQKIPIYEELMDFWSRLISDPQLGKKPPTEQEVVEFMSSFLKKMIVWGSDDVLKAFQEYRYQAMVAQSDDQNPIEILFSFESLLFAIRKDLGHKNKDLYRGDILQLWVNDTHKYL